MRNKKIIISTVVLTLFSTGCVKPTEEVNTDNTAQGTNVSDDTVVYTEEPSTTTYEDSSPIIYGDPTTTTTPNNNVIYGTPTGDDGTIIATDHYQPAVGSSTGTGSGAYGTPTDGGEIYNSVDDPYTTTGSNTYSNN
ncbi:MAG: hypothetical protein KAU90_07105, partial [Sulfurovaceae bacterium]|nr:hypothetical protein [Sulfurovaceae bacterium]